MGDNRLNSADSRYHITDELQGTVPVSNIRGKVRFIIYPLSGSVVSTRSTRRSRHTEVAVGNRWPPRRPVRRAANLRTLEFALHTSGLGPVAGVDEAGRGACAGPLVVAACILKNPHRSPRSPISTTRRSSRNRRASACIARSPATRWPGTR